MPAAQLLQEFVPSSRPEPNLSVAGPFVDMIPAVVAPLIAKRLSRWADNVSEKAQARGGHMLPRKDRIQNE